MKKTKQIGDVLNVEETADYLRLNRITIYRYYKLGKLPGQKIGNKLRFSKKALEEFLAGTKKQETVGTK